MFTGIVEGIGLVSAVRNHDGGRRLRITSEELAPSLSPGGSVSVNGACLTVETLDGDAGWFSVFLAGETVDRTALGRLETGDAVNLERAMPADGRFDGHIVQGHVDGTAEIVSIERIGEDRWVTVSLPEPLARYVVEKGSITVDGISLTVADLDTESFSVAIIPATYEATTLKTKEPGDPVHLEVDVIAKYVERLVRERR